MSKLFLFSVLCKLVRQDGDNRARKLADEEKSDFSNNQRIIEANGWQFVCRSHGNIPANEWGYHGIAFRKGNQLVISHRGTQFREIGNIAADLLLSAQIPPEGILLSAQEFTRFCLDQMSLIPN